MPGLRGRIKKLATERAPASPHLDIQPGCVEACTQGVDRDYPVRRQPKHRVLRLNLEEDAYAVDD